MYFIFVLLISFIFLYFNLLMNNSIPPTLNNGQSRIDEESAFINARINKQTQLDISQTLSDASSTPEVKCDPDPLVKQPFVKPDGDISRKY